MEINIISVIEDRLPDLTRAQRKIGEAILFNPKRFVGLSMHEIAVEVGTSEPTVVRFSREFGMSGLKELRIALAMSVGLGEVGESKWQELSHDDKTLILADQKLAIAREAANLVETDGAIFLDSGSTVRQLAKFLHNANPLTIMTTSLPVLLELQGSSQHKLMLSGGNFRRDSLSLTGRLAETAISDLVFDTAYIGADSIDLDHGLSTFSENEAHLTSAVIRSARRVVVLADVSKFGAARLQRICSFDNVDVIVTSAEVPDEILGRLKDKGVRVILSNFSTVAK
ncbi:MAG: hypothetical protein V3U96_06980 [Paracoccaceae bacterium]